MKLICYHNIFVGKSPRRNQKEFDRKSIISISGKECIWRNYICTVNQIFAQRNEQTSKNTWRVLCVLSSWSKLCTDLFILNISLVSPLSPFTIMIMTSRETLDFILSFGFVADIFKLHKCLNTYTKQIRNNLIKTEGEKKYPSNQLYLNSQKK